LLSFTVVRRLFSPCSLVTYRPLIADRYLPPDDFEELRLLPVPPFPLGIAFYLLRGFG
jgi:hypothetical protein